LDTDEQDKNFIDSQEVASPLKTCVPIICENLKILASGFRRNGAKKKNQTSPPFL
jgi:hypothetical protein